MQHSNSNIVKKTAIAIMLLLFIASDILPARAAVIPAARAPLKSQMADEDADEIVEAVKKANVLFLMESTAAMSFSPKGAMPVVIMNPKWNYGTMEAADWKKTKDVYGYGFNDAQNLMSQSTFGMGALPAAWSGLSVMKGRNLYGKDIVGSNNYVKSGGTIEADLEANKDKYYFPFADPARAMSIKEAYSNQKDPLETHFTGESRPYDAKTHYQADYTVISKYMGASQTARYVYNNLDNGPFPYALVFKDPKYWKTGWTGSGSPAADDLVPNDSRMYQAKLALWRLLEDEDLFRNIRIGLATTFLSPVNTANGFPNRPYVGNDHHTGGSDRTDFNTIFRVRPFGGNIYTQRYFDSQNNYSPANYWDYSMDSKRPDGAIPVPPNLKDRYSTLQFKNGILLMNITGHPSAWEGMHGQFFTMWANTQVAPNYNMENDPYGWKSGWTDTERSLFKLENRASLHVPIADYDYTWQKKYNYKTYEMKHADKIRLWINGLADMKSAGPTLAVPYTTRTDAKSFTSNTDKEARNSQFHYFKDPEIGIAGTFALPNAIFPDPNPKYDLSREVNIERGSRSVWYSDSVSNTNYIGYHRIDKTQDLGSSKAYFNAGSGEAAGSVIDFFSPYIYYKIAKEDIVRRGYVANSKAMGPENLVDLSFPIRNACEDNWLVIIASGMEIEPVDDKSYSYNSWDAIKNLYEYTDAKKNKTGRGRLTRMSYKWDAGDGRKKRKLELIDLERPIRTLVIGIVADPEDPEIKKDPVLREQVGKMRTNLNRMARAGQGADPYDNNSDITAYFADDVPSLIDAIKEAMNYINDFPTERPGKGAVPSAPSSGSPGETLDMYAYSYRAMRSDQWVGSLWRYEASRDNAGNLVMTRSWELGDSIRKDRGRRNLKYWSGASGRFVDLMAGDPNFMKLTGMTDKSMSSHGLPPGSFSSYPPHKALYAWMQGYDHSYARGMDFERSNMLADIGQSAITLVSDPPEIDSLPGHMAWAKHLRDKNLTQPPTLYLQTNDGILHTVDPKSGDEKSAILPPPALLPARLATLKTRIFENKMEWIDVQAPEGSGKLRSNPVYTLDGSLQKRNFDMSSPRDGSGWGTYLLGALGRGGSGLYMLDVSSRGNPKLLWYREKVGNAMAAMDSSSNEPVIARYSDLSGFEKPYMKLGFNSPRPGMGVTGGLRAREQQNFIAMAGGTQTNVDLSNNGLEGATLLLLDPKDGRVLREFDSAHLGRTSSKIGGGEKGPAPYMGMMNSELTLFRSNISPYLTGRIFAADNRGNIFRVSMEGKDASGAARPLGVSGWRISTIATLQADDISAAKNSHSYSIPHGLSVGSVKGMIWASGGTADSAAGRSKDYPRGVIPNESQMIFGLRADIEGAPFTRAKMKSISSGDPMSSLTSGENYMGWYIPLMKRSSRNFREYVSAKPVLINGTLFISTFIQRGRPEDDDLDVCAFKKNINGDSRLYALDVTSGAANFWSGGDKSGKAKYITLDGVRITGITEVKNGNRNSLLVSLDNLSGNFDPKGVGQKNVKGIDGSPNMVEVTGLPASAGGSSKVTSGDSVILYWSVG